MQSVGLDGIGDRVAVVGGRQCDAAGAGVVEVAGGECVADLGQPVEFEAEGGVVLRGGGGHDEVGGDLGECVVGVAVGVAVGMVGGAVKPSVQKAGGGVDFAVGVLVLAARGAGEVGEDRGVGVGARFEHVYCLPA